MFFVFVLGTKSTPPTKMTSLTSQVSHSSVEEQSNRQSGQVMGSIPHWDSENFLFWVGELQDLSFYLKSRLSKKVKWNRSISDRFYFQRCTRLYLRRWEVNVISDKNVCSVKVTIVVLIMDCEVSQVPRRLGRQLCNTAVMTLPE